MKTALALVMVAGLAGVANADVVVSNVGGSWPASPGTGSYTDTLSVPAADSIDFISITIAHTWSSDLIISVAGTNGSTFSLLNRPGTSSRDLGTLDGAGALVPAEYFFIESGGNVWGALAGTQIPSGAANSYNALSWTPGALAAGDYTITVTDTIGGDGATITGWSIGYTVPTPGAAALLGLGALAAGRRRRA